MYEATKNHDISVSLREKSTAFYHYGLNIRASQGPEPSLSKYKEAVRLARRLHAHEDSVESMNFLADSVGFLTDALRASKEPRSAVEYLIERHNLLKKINQIMSTPESRKKLVISCWQLAEFYSDVGMQGEAHSAIKLLAHLTSEIEFDDEDDYRLIFHISHFRLAEFELCRKHSYTFALAKEKITPSSARQVINKFNLRVHACDLQGITRRLNSIEAIKTTAEGLSILAHLYASAGDFVSARWATVEYYTHNLTYKHNVGIVSGAEHNRICYPKIGVAQFILGDFESAHFFLYEAALNASSFYTRNPVEGSRNLAVLYWMLFRLNWTIGDDVNANDFYNEGANFAFEFNKYGIQDGNQIYIEYYKARELD